MKKITIVVFIILTSFSILSAQTEKTKPHFSDVKIAYNYAFKMYNINSEKFPFGISIATSIELSKKFQTNIGISFKTQKEIYSETKIYQDPIAYTNVIRNQHKYSFIDIPIHLQYSIINSNSFDLYVSTGAMPSFFLYNENWTPYSNGQDYHFKGYVFNLAIQIGLMQSYNINNQFSVFASQDIGHYLLKPHKNDEQTIISYLYTAKNTIDLKLGVIYKF
jgi:hypothetical protein